MKKNFVSSVLFWQLYLIILIEILNYIRVLLRIWDLYFSYPWRWLLETQNKIQMSSSVNEWLVVIILPRDRFTFKWKLMLLDGKNGSAFLVARSLTKTTFLPLLIFLTKVSDYSNLQIALFQKNRSKTNSKMFGLIVFPRRKLMACFSWGSTLDVRDCRHVWLRKLKWSVGSVTYFFCKT